MAKRGRTPSIRADDQGKPTGRRARPDIVHTSIYLPKAIHDALREIAYRERVKIHDVIIEGIGLALKKRRYPAAGRTTAAGRS